MGGHVAHAPGASRRLRVPSPAAALVLAALALALVLSGACLVLTFLTRDFRVAAENAWAIPALVFAVLGAVVAWHQPRNPIGWLLVACGCLYLLVSAAGLYAVLDYQIHHGTPAIGRAAVLTEALAFLVAVTFGLVVVLFPDGRLASRRWRWVLWIYVIACAMFLANQFIGQSTVLAASHLQVDFTGSPLNNPNPSGALAQVAGIGDRFGAVILACWVCFIGRQVLSYRHTGGDRRQQLKWLMTGAVICIVATVATILASGSDSPGAQAVQAAGHLGIVALPASVDGEDLEVPAVRHRPDHLPDPGLRHRHRPAGRPVRGTGAAGHPDPVAPGARWRWPRPRWPRRRCLIRCGDECSGRWTAGSTGPGTTPTRP